MRRRSGQALVEFALVAPFLMVLFAAILEFGWTFYQLNYLNTAARTACRVLADQATADNSVVNSVVFATCPVALSAPPTVTVTSVNVSGNTCTLGTAQANTNRTPGNVITVYLRAPYWAFTRIVDLSALGGMKELRAQYSFVIQASGR